MVQDGQGVTARQPGHRVDLVVDLHRSLLHDSHVPVQNQLGAPSIHGELGPGEVMDHGGATRLLRDLPECSAPPPLSGLESSLGKAPVPLASSVNDGDLPSSRSLAPEDAAGHTCQVHDADDDPAG
jgi:hypothetical protein